MAEGPTEFDVVVVGAGPAGATAARAVAASGASVLLVDRARFPRWKVCGACLSPGALTQLGLLGLGDLPASLGAVPLASFVLRARAGVARLPLRGSMALSRTALDLALVSAAARAGVTFWSGARAELGESGRDHRVVHVSRNARSTPVAARVVVDATGLGCGLSADGRPASRPRTGARVGLGCEARGEAYPVAPGELHMAIGREGYVGLVRTETGCIGVAAAVEPSALALGRPERVVNGILAAGGLPPLAPGATTRWRGTPPLTRVVGALGEHRLLRLGDAAGYTEPFTGQGIGWALADGRGVAALASRAVERWSDALLEEWRDYRGGRRARSERLCRGLARALRRPWMVHAAVRALSAAPALSTPFVREAGRSPDALVAKSA
jgi:flavin-dependent dehydrogenase